MGGYLLIEGGPASTNKSKTGYNREYRVLYREGLSQKLGRGKIQRLDQSTRGNNAGPIIPSMYFSAAPHGR
jgi:hypothetical protein